MPLQIRRGLEAERSTLTSLNGLVVGELLYTTDGKKLYVGPGPGVFGDARDYQGVAITGYTDEDAQDAAASLFTSGTHNNITFAYVDGSDRINATINLSNYAGVIKADSFNGSVVADNSTVLIDGTEGSFNLDGTVKGDIVPNADSAYDLGSSSYKFKDLFLSGSSIHLGNAILTSSGSAINLPAGSTINGEPLNSPLQLTEISANVIADDSTILVNTTSKVVTAAGGFVGNLLGDVTGDVTGNLSGDVTGDVTGNLLGDVTGNLSGDVTGDVTGNLLGDVTGDVTGNINGIVTGTFGSSINGTLKGTVYAFDDATLVDSTTKIFYGTVDTGGAVLTATTLTASPAFDIGTASSILQLTLNLDGNLKINQTISPSGSGYITTTQSRGTQATPAAVQAGDELGGLLFRAYTDSSTTGIAGIIGVGVDPTAVIAGGDFIKSQIVISASSDTNNDPADALIINSAGVSTSNAFSASKYFQLPTYANDAARSSAIPVPAQGMMVFMQSGTSPSVTNKTVVYDGSAWVALH
jgi:hypothetical protein